MGILLAKITIHNPSELYTADENLKVLKLLTQFNTAWLADKKLSHPEKYSFKNEKDRLLNIG